MNAIIVSKIDLLIQEEQKTNKLLQELINLFLRYDSEFSKEMEKQYAPRG